MIKPNAGGLLLGVASSLTLAVFLICASVAANAQSAAYPIGGIRGAVEVIDWEKLFRESLLGKALLKRLQNDEQKLKTENLTIQKTLEAEEKDITEAKGKLSEAEFGELSGAFDEKVIRIRSEQDDKEKKLVQRRSEYIGLFDQVLNQVVLQYQDDTGTSLIFDINTTRLWASEQSDITDEIRLRIDQYYNSGAISLDQVEK